jgi:hypothetical protein
VKLAGIEDQTLLLDVIDINRQSTETTVDRYEAFTENVVSVEIHQSMNVEAGEASRPYRVRLDTRKQQDIVISGIRVKFVIIQPFSVHYTLEDLQPQ